MNKYCSDQQALDIARQLHLLSAAKLTFLFGSRARGDHRPNSDIDILIITGTTPAEPWRQALESTARRIQKAKMPRASGIDIIFMTEADFLKKRRLRNNLANTVVKEGCPAMANENLGYRADHGDEEVDWQDVEQKLNDAKGAADWIEAIRESGILDAGDDKQFGRVAQNALEFAYKAAIAAHGHDYPTSGRDGHNLTILAQLVRTHGIVDRDQEVPGENHRYLSEFGGAAVYAHEHPPLNRGLIAEEIPSAVAQLRQIAQDPKT